MSISAIQIDPKDTVACLLRDHRAGECALLPAGPTAPLCTDIPLGHKVALIDIKTGESVIKFGASIGLATADISAGEHVHLHNLQ